MGGTATGADAALAVKRDILSPVVGGQPFMPRKPLDGREHGGRLFVSKATRRACAAVAPAPLAAHLARVQAAKRLRFCFQLRYAPKALRISHR